MAIWEEISLPGTGGLGLEWMDVIVDTGISLAVQILNSYCTITTMIHTYILYVLCTYIIMCRLTCTVYLVVS